MSPLKLLCCSVILIATIAVPMMGQADPPRISTEGTKVVLLGTGTPNADPERSGPAVAIVINETPYLVDFGPGVVRRAAAAARAGFLPLRVANLKLAFVTHLHSDHTAGYFRFDSQSVGSRTG